MLAQREAQSNDILQLILTQGVGLAALGLGIGLLASARRCRPGVRSGKHSQMEFLAYISTMSLKIPEAVPSIPPPLPWITRGVSLWIAVLIETSCTDP